MPKAPRSRRRRRRGGEVWGRGDSLPSRPNPNPNPNPRRPPHSHLTPPIRGTPANIPRNLIYPETRIIGLHFCRRLHGSILIQICTMGSKTRIFACCNRVLAEVGFWRQIAAQGPSRSCILQSILPTRVSISLYNNPGLISENSEEVAIQMAKNCRRQPPHSHCLLYTSPSPRD